MSRKRKDDHPSYFEENKRRVVTNGGSRITLRNRENEEWPGHFSASPPPPAQRYPPARQDYSNRPRGGGRDYYDPPLQERNGPPYLAQRGNARDDYRNDFREHRGRDMRDNHDMRDNRDMRDMRDKRDNRGYPRDYPPLPIPPVDVFDPRLIAPPRIDVHPPRDLRRDARVDIRPRGPPAYAHDPRDQRDDRRDDRRDTKDRVAVFNLVASRGSRRNTRNDDFHPQQRDARQIIRANSNNNTRTTSRQQNIPKRNRPLSDIHIPNIDMGTVNKGQLAQKFIDIQNDGHTTSRFFGVELRRRDNNLKMNDPKGLCSNLLGSQFKPNINVTHRELGPNKSYTITFEYNTDQIGAFNNQLIFHFDSGLITKKFSIKIVELADEALLAPSKPYKPLIVRNRTLPAIREKPLPSSSSSSSSSSSLAINSSLDSLRANRKQQQRKSGGPNNNANDNLDMFDMALEDLLPTAEQPLTPESHSPKFQALLAIENKQMEVDIRMYDMTGVTLKKIPSQPTGYSLQVPGIAENRPSVLLRDIVYFKRTGEENAKEYPAEVVGVSREDIDVKFDDNFPLVRGASYDVRFTFTKIFAHRMMRTLGSPLPSSFLFPKPSSTPLSKLNTPPLKLFNPELNEQQKLAVARIVHSPNYNAPYVIFGPPGTGKTLTLVEAIAQLLQKSSNSTSILVCAPSNQACDVIIERLANYPSLADMNLYRLNAIQRNVEEVSDVVRRYCVIVGGSFVSPTGQQLASYSLIVCTCIFAGVLVELKNNGSFKKQFTHIIVDEAGHGLEPEILVPLSLRGPKTQVTIAGDPFQLGPTVRSNYARTNGLEKSFLERLCEKPPYTRYEDDGNLLPEIVANNFHNPEYVTKLVRNYRSHPAILQLPNRLFYHGDLVEAADHDMTHSLLSFKFLPSLEKRRSPFPIVFHGLNGEDTREGTSPSFFNVMEATAIHNWIQKLIEDTTLNPRVTLQDVGVIAPFRKQVQKIRMLLAGRGKESVKVGSVEDFQGQEKRIIIISGVRSSHTFVEFDRKHKLGLLENPKRFNVAVTRAKALLIVVANPEILALDENWAEFIRYCYENNSYTGAPLPESILNPKTTTQNTNTETTTSTTTTTSNENGEQERGKEDGKGEGKGEEMNEEEQKDAKMGDTNGVSGGSEGRDREKGSEEEEQKQESKDNQTIQEDGEGDAEGEAGGENKQEDEANVEDRDVTLELDVGSVITGQEGPEWRGSF